VLPERHSQSYVRAFYRAIIINLVFPGANFFYLPGHRCFGRSGRWDRSMGRCLFVLGTMPDDQSFEPCWGPHCSKN
jgi:hypothetical protein